MTMRAILVFGGLWWSLWSAIVCGRGIDVNLTANWLSSSYFPVLEASEFLAEDSPHLFWTYVDSLREKSDELQEIAGKNDMEKMQKVALDIATDIAPSSSKMLELMLSMRAYSPKVELHKQLAMDSNVRLCGVNATSWAVIYREDRCVEAYACAADEVDDMLAKGTGKSAQSCAAAGVNDVAMDIDHKYLSNDGTQPTVILYSLIGTSEFYAFHDKLVPEAKSNKVQYIVRHYPQDTSIETLLQGYGVALHIKNMEYKTIDDSKESLEDDDVVVDTSEEDEDVDGLLFHTLSQRHPKIQSDLRTFQKQLITQHEEEQEIKAWHLQDLGITAAKHIIDSDAPLERLQSLSQDFPRHAKKLAFSSKEISSELREEVSDLHQKFQRSNLMHKFVVNGIRIDPSVAFNVFDFAQILRKEDKLSSELKELPLSNPDRDRMLANVLEEERSNSGVRINVRGPVDGNAPFYLNDMSSDENTKHWPSSLTQLGMPTWNLIFLRHNMYEQILAFDPLSLEGRNALNQVLTLRMRGAPLQFGLVFQDADIINAASKEKVDELVASRKDRKIMHQASSWHVAKLLFLLRDKEVGEKQKGRTRPIFTFLENIAVFQGDGITIDDLISCYTDAMGSSEKTKESRKEAVEAFQSDRFDDRVMEMMQLSKSKQLPLDSSLFNGVLSAGVSIQEDIMMKFGRDQEQYQSLYKSGNLDGDKDLITQLLDAQETYSTYFTLFDMANESPKAKRTSSLLDRDSDGQFALMLEKEMKYLHAPESLHTPKMQSILFSGDLSNQRHANGAYQAVKVVLEDTDKSSRISILPWMQDTVDTAVSSLITAILDTVETSDEESHLSFILEALDAAAKGLSYSDIIKRLQSTLEKVSSDGSDMWKSIRDILQTTTPINLINSETKATYEKMHTLLQAHVSPTSTLPPAMLFINGLPVDLPASPLSEDAMQAIQTFEAKHRSQAIAKVFLDTVEDVSVQIANRMSHDIVVACGLIDRYKRSKRVSTPDVSGFKSVRTIPGDTNLHVSAYVDPLSETAQVMSSLLLTLHHQLHATVELVLIPSTDYAEFPLQRFYRYVFGVQPTYSSTMAQFRKLPAKPILTMNVDTPEAWNVQVERSEDDLDNLRVDLDNAADIRSNKGAEYRLQNLLVYGQCRDATFNQFAPPNGLQLNLEREAGAVKLHHDTLVMKNLGYFQLQATPGIWSLTLAQGRASELFEIVDKKDLEQELASLPVVVSSFESDVTQLVVHKRLGKELDHLLFEDGRQPSRASDNSMEDEGLFASYWQSMVSIFRPTKGNNQVLPTQELHPAVNKGRRGETIHVFSLATGHLYERFLRIMMLSVLKRTDNPVTFWLLENFLSPAFKESIPALQKEFGMDIRLVTYKWPSWLRQQTEKQRIIWGYKILFLDVLFPLGVQKIIYVDADQVVRSDLKELWDMDLQGAPYGYTPFCDSRNLGFQFWRQGYWNQHLRGKPYHISALYVVDLALFRQIAAGDKLRATYDQLSADPNSLSNLDQDLPNYMQHQLPIFSLPQEWLWCESWCSDETKAEAKTIDLCNNPKHKEPKLDMAKRVISGDLFPESWIDLDQEVRDAEARFEADVRTE